MGGMKLKITIPRKPPFVCATRARLLCRARNCFAHGNLCERIRNRIRLDFSSNGAFPISLPIIVDGIGSVQMSAKLLYEMCRLYVLLTRCVLMGGASGRMYGLRVSINMCEWFTDGIVNNNLIFDCLFIEIWCILNVFILYTCME